MWLIAGTSRSFIWCIVTCYSRLFISYVHSFRLYKEHIHNMYAQFLCMTLFPCNKWSFRSTSLLFHRVYMFCSLDNKVGESPRTMEQVLQVCSPAAQHTCPCGRSRDRRNPPCAREGVEAVTVIPQQTRKRREWARRWREHIQIPFTVAGLFARRHVEGTKPHQDKQVGSTTCSVCRRVRLFFTAVFPFLIRGLKWGKSGISAVFHM